MRFYYITGYICIKTISINTDEGFMEPNPKWGSSYING